VAGYQKMQSGVFNNGRVCRAHQVEGPLVNHQLAEEANHDGFRRQFKTAPGRLPVDSAYRGVNTIVDDLHAVTQALFPHPVCNRLTDRHDSSGVRAQPARKPPAPGTRRQDLA